MSCVLLVKTILFKTYLYSSTNGVYFRTFEWQSATCCGSERSLWDGSFDA